jgi:DNA-binding helix-hairpin-helix protein with protein kinase domain
MQDSSMPEVHDHHYANLGDVRLHHVIMSRKPAVVLLHRRPQT